MPFASPTPMKKNPLEELRAKVALTNEDNSWSTPEAQELLRLERLHELRAIKDMHPGNRFRLMAGLSLLPES
jgi:hypothetical protein